MTTYLNIQDRFNVELPADAVRENFRRQVKNACFSFVAPKKPSSPKLLHIAQPVAKLIGWPTDALDTEEFLSIFSGSKRLPNSQPYAMCYGGHQFGHWAGQLGDGRAINLAEVDNQGQSWQLQLKGAGETPYSRNADGLAVLRSSIREHLCSEAMHYLGVPTTRSLSIITTGDRVLRDIMYDGHPAYEAGAVVCRVAPSFIRFGNFEILAAQKDENTLRQLLDFTIKYHFPDITVELEKARYLTFFESVVDKTLSLILQWMRVGFVHGVMNTDNMSILGLTIDYGPYGWLEPYDENWTPNTTDLQNRRYRFGQQFQVAMWNLAQLANALMLIIKDAPALEEILHRYYDHYQIKYYEMMCQKLGLTYHAKDKKLIDELTKTLSLVETDMTIFFRNLAQVSLSAQDQDRSSIPSIIVDAFYHPNQLTEEQKEAWLQWLQKYMNRAQQETLPSAKRQQQMNQVNPKYVLRNYMAQLAIEGAEKGEVHLLEELYELLQHPYAEQPQHEKWFAKRPEWARDKIGCAMLSCSS